MNNKLLDKLKQSQNKIKNKLKDNLNINSQFSTLTDEEISLVLALRAKKIRVSKNKKQKEFSSEINLSSTSTYSNFEQKGNISMLNFIKVMRGFGLLNELEKLLQPSITQKIESINKEQKQRVR